MARTNKKGLDYFPVDVDFFDDDKIQLIEAEFGHKGPNIALRLLCKIYKCGYFYQWGDDQCLLFTKSVGGGVVSNLVNEVVNGLVKRGFFDEAVFNSFGILTSKGIQERYFDAVIRYKKVEATKEYLLIDVSKMINVYINSINVYINSNNDNTCTHNERENEKEKEREINTTLIPPENPIFKKVKNRFDLSISECKQQFFEDELHIFRLKKQFGEKILEWVEKYFDQQELEGKTEKSLMDAKSHFTRWYQLKQNSNEKSRRNIDTTAHSTAETF